MERTVEDAGPYRFVPCATSSANVTFAVILSVARRRGDNVKKHPLRRYAPALPKGEPLEIDSSSSANVTATAKRTNEEPSPVGEG